MILPKRLMGAVACLLPIAAAAPAFAKTAELSGSMQEAGSFTRHLDLKVPADADEVTVRLALPPSHQTYGADSRLGAVDVTSIPAAAVKATSTDTIGNKTLSLTFPAPLPRTISIDATYSGLSVSVDFSHALPLTSLPLANVPDDVKPYLKPTALIQSDADSVKTMAAALGLKATGEAQTAEEFCVWMADDFGGGPSGKTSGNEDAVSVLGRKSGGPTGWTQLFIAMCRASGIPARMVHGLTTSGKLSMPTEPGAADTVEEEYSAGQSVWAEIWYPVAGWVPYDPAESMGFVDCHHLPEAFGKDDADFIHPLEWRSTTAPPGDITQTETFDCSGLKDSLGLVCSASRRDDVAGLLLSRPTTAPPSPK